MSVIDFKGARALAQEAKARRSRLDEEAKARRSDYELEIIIERAVRGESLSRSEFSRFREELLRLEEILAEGADSFLDRALYERLSTRLSRMRDALR